MTEWLEILLRKIIQILDDDSYRISIKIVIKENDNSRLIVFGFYKKVSLKYMQKKCLVATTVMFLQTPMIENASYRIIP